METGARRIGHEATEARIATRLDAGDLQGAATEALQAYGPSLLRYLRSMLGGEDIAYEVFSEFTEALWTGLPRFRREASVRTWAFRLAWTTAQDWRRRAARNRTERLDTSEATKLAAEIRSTTPAHLRADVEQRWRVLKATLSDEERSLLLLRFEQGMSWHDVARVMANDATQANATALRKRFERLKARLRASAQHQGREGG